MDYHLTLNRRRKSVRAETRHQLKEDRFSKATLHAAEQTVHWTVEHQSKLLIAGIVVEENVGIWISRVSQPASYAGKASLTQLPAHPRGPAAGDATRGATAAAVPRPELPP